MTIDWRRAFINTAVGVFCAAAVSSISAQQAQTSTSKIAFNIPRQSVGDALTSLGQQSGLTIILASAVDPGTLTPAIVGNYTTDAALQKILAPAGLRAEYLDSKTVAIRTARSDTQEPEQGLDKSAPRSGKGAVEPGKATSQKDKASSDRPPSTSEETNVEDSSTGNRRQAIQRAGVPEVLVKGSRGLNTDIERTPDDAQPYVVIDSAMIQRSGASNIEDLLSKTLGANTQPIIALRGSSSPGSQINLRGLGTNQTLILIDGRRALGLGQSGSPHQPDLNGIPLSAIERIEILPTTASGIYGGGATGGVVNVILRHDYNGVEATLTDGGTFDGGGASRRVDLAGGLTSASGKTSLIAYGTYSHLDPIAFSDRDFLQHARSIIAQNDPPANLKSGFYPPLAATPNLFSVNGSPLFGPGTPNYTSVPVGYAGGGGISPLEENAGKYNLALADTAQSYGGAVRSLEGGDIVKSAMATLRHHATDSLDLFLEAATSRNTGTFEASGTDSSSFILSASAPNNPFGQSVYVTTPVASGDGEQRTTNESVRLVGGFISRVSHDWVIGADYSWEQGKLTAVNIAGGISAQGMAALTGGSIDVLRDTTAFPLDLNPYLLSPIKLAPWRSISRDAVLRAAGPISLPDEHQLQLSTTLEHLEDSYSRNSTLFPTNPIPTIYPGNSQSVDSLYVELTVPLVGSLRTGDGQHLEMQVAGRYDHYTVNGTTLSVLQTAESSIVGATNTNHSVNPTIALRYEPIPALLLRGSFGTGFLPPAVDQLAPAFETVVTTVQDPKRGGAAVNLPVGTLKLDGNPNLRPETSRSWSAGFVLKPPVVGDFRMSIDYSRIEKRDNISSLGTTTILANEDVFPGRVVRAAPAPGDPFSVGPIIAIDDTLANISRSTVASYDAQLNYGVKTGIGQFELAGMATMVDKYQTQLLPVTPVIDHAGISGPINGGYGVPLRFKGNLQLTWTLSHATVGWSTRYFHSYELDNSYAQAFGISYQYWQINGGPDVPSQTYHDLFASYEFSRPGPFTSLTVQLNVNNVLNKEPPFDPSQNSYYSTFGDPRLRSYQVSVKAQF